MSKNGGTVGLVIKWSIISAVVVGVLSYFGIVNVNDQRIKSRLDQAQYFIADIFGKAEDTVVDTVGGAKRELGAAKSSVEGTVKGAVNTVEDVVDDAAGAAKGAAKDAGRSATGVANEVKQELQ